MKPHRLSVVLFAGTLAALAGASAQAWWDTVCTVYRPVPLVKEVEAEDCVGIAKELIVEDPQANGGRGGKAVILQPGGPALTTEFALEPGLYAVFTIARHPEGKIENSVLTLEVTDKSTGQTRSWTMVVIYRESYFAVGQMYFPAYSTGRYTVAMKMEPNGDKLDISKYATFTTPDKPDPTVKALFDHARQLKLEALWVDRLELRDALGNTAKVAAKTRRMLSTDEEVAEARRKFAAQDLAKTTVYVGPDVFPLDPKRTPWWPNGRAAGERRARNERLWALMPDFNSHISDTWEKPYHHLIEGTATGRSGMLPEAADLYYKTGNAEFGWDGAVLLCALAERWPSIDYVFHGWENLTDRKQPFTFSKRAGKTVYRGHAGPLTAKLARNYDELFDFIKDNEDLAAFVGTKIPWVKTPQDVVKLIDVYFLQASMDECNRTYIAGEDSEKVLLPLVQGVNPVSDQMLRTGIFTSMCMNSTFRGGVDDHAICSYSRDGVHYIGSVEYINQDLLGIGRLLHQYCQAGGSPRFDLMDATRYPQMTEAEHTIPEVRVAGGYRLIIGDGGTFGFLREARVQPNPSRVLGGFGAAILESGQFGEDPLKMRAVGLYSGIGRGHAHRDTLNIEVIAHGCRVVPDLGGRHEGKLHGSPNMRSNRVHNLVEVDDRDFVNEYPGSATSATGWTTSCSPQPGAQFMEHQARATSHPNVSLYERQTTLVDVGDAESYLFDVFRVKGGKVHTYCFHGGVCATGDLRVNADLKPAASAEATAYLQQHFEGTRKEGVTPAVLQADWLMEPGQQQKYQGVPYDAQARVTTRLVLFGHEGERLMAGNAWSEAYQYNFPFLYVQGAQTQEGRESVYPAVIEPFAGQPFLAGKRLLPVAAAQPGAETGVAVEVKTVSGLTDLLYAGKPGADVATVDGRVKVSGKFAMLRRDAQGFVLAHLVGGAELSDGDMALRAEKPGYEGRMTQVNYARRSLLLDQPWPADLLKGAVAQLGNAGHHESFKLESLETAGNGTKVTLEKTSIYYQSAVLNVDEKAGTVECEIEPVVFGCDTKFADGTTITNEKQDKFWKATLLEGDRWMNLGFPGYRGSWPNKLTWDDFPDANHDGKRTLTLIGTKGVKNEQGVLEEDKPVLTMEVTRISPDGETFYFKLPEDPAYRKGGWNYANREMVNEDGSKRWRAVYPGSSFRWKVEGAISPADFTDEDKDGKVKMTAHVFGPGDSMKVDSFVYVRRATLDTEKGATPRLYEVRSNVACTIALPKGAFTSAQLSPDGKAFRPIAAADEGRRLAVRLSAADLAGGTVWLKMAP